jgi:hypothetical protein
VSDGFIGYWCGFPTGILLASQGPRTLSALLGWCGVTTIVVKQPSDDE